MVSRAARAGFVVDNVTCQALPPWLMGCGLRQFTEAAGISAELARGYANERASDFGVPPRSRQIAQGMVAADAASTHNHFKAHTATNLSYQQTMNTRVEKQAPGSWVVFVNGQRDINWSHSLTRVSEN